MTENAFWTHTKTSFNTETDMSVFKTWNVVQSVPIYSFRQFEDHYGPEVFMMISQQSNSQLWSNALKEPFDGHTSQSYNFVNRVKNGVEYTPWTLKTAHHLLTYVTESGNKLTDFDQIVEFGPGIGEAARMVCHLGFSGDYYLYDLPEVGRISSHYNRNNPNVKLVSSYSEIDPSKKTLFISTWGISEVPFDLRNDVFNHFRDASYCLIYQNMAFEYDNDKYFSLEFTKIVSKELKRVRIPFLDGIADGNYYLIS
jgi:hypothetical protein